MLPHDFPEKLEKAIKDTLSATNRPFYHEYDLEYHLACKLHKSFENKPMDNELTDISMEFPTRIEDSEQKKTDRTKHIDMLLEFKSNTVIPIELKHVSTEGSNNGGFVLYDFLDDIMRLERFLQTPKDNKGNSLKVPMGYVLFVTDDAAIYGCKPCCNGPCKRASCTIKQKGEYYPLRLYSDVDGIKALSKGEYYWVHFDKNDDGEYKLRPDYIKKERPDRIILENDYSVQWKYVENTANPEIKYHYLLIPVTAPKQEN